MGELAENLPQEVMHDILSWLPIKHIVRFRCVSKPWLHLAFDTQFIKLHSQTNNNKINQPPSIIALRIGKQPKLYYAPAYTACDKAIEFDLPFPKLSYGFYFISGICNGLICLSLHKEDNENLSNVYVWNPLTRNHITIPCPLATHVSNSFGFGYHEGSDEYKVVRLLWNSNKVSPCVCVYTLGTASWRQLGDLPYDVSSHNSHVPLVNGALHWIATNTKLRSSKTIISFDIKDEVFQEIPLPNGLTHDGLFRARVCEYNGLLCVTYEENHGMCQLWVMKEYGVVDSWIKQCEFEPSALPGFSFGDFSHFQPLCRASSQDIIMITGPWQLSLYNSKNSSITKLTMFKGCIYALLAYSGRLTSAKSCQLSQ